MSGIQVLVLLQIVFQFMVSGQVYENLTLPSIQNSSLAEKTGYIEFPEFEAAYKMSEIELPYDEARKMCLEDGGQLAVIDSREKVEKIVDHFTASQHLWVGLYRFHNTDVWTTINGKSTNNLPWADGKPRGEYRCGLLSRLVNGLINWNCWNAKHYLCEIALPTN